MANLTVTGIKRWKNAGDSQSHTLAIRRVADGSIVAQKNVSMAGTPVGGGSTGWIVGTLDTPVTLTDGECYDILSTEVSGGDSWTDKLPSDNIQTNETKATVVGARVGDESFGNVGTFAVGHRAHDGLDLVIAPSATVLTPTSSLVTSFTSNPLHNYYTGCLGYQIFIGQSNLPHFTSLQGFALGAGGDNVAVNASGNRYAYIAPISGNCAVNFKTNFNESGQPYSLFEFNDGTNAFQLVFYADGVSGETRAQVNGGTQAGGILTAVPSDTFGIGRVGTTINVYKNGTIVFTFSQSSTAGSTVNCFFACPTGNNTGSGFNSIVVTQAAYLATLSVYPFLTANVARSISAELIIPGAVESDYTFQWSSPQSGVVFSSATSRTTNLTLPSVGTYNLQLIVTNTATGSTQTLSAIVSAVAASVPVVKFNGTAVVAGSTVSARQNESFVIDLLDSTSTDSYHTDFWYVGSGSSDALSAEKILKSFLAKTLFSYRKVASYPVRVTTKNLAGDATTFDFTINSQPQYTYGTPQNFTTVAALQSAINSATGGEHFRLTKGSYQLSLGLYFPATALTAPVLVESSGDLPLNENRVQRTDISELCTLHAPTTGGSIDGRALCDPCLVFASQSNNWHVRGFHLTTNSTTPSFIYHLALFGSSFADDATESALPHHIRFQHILATSDAASYVRRSICAHVNDFELYDSLLVGAQGGNADCQAIALWNGGARHRYDNVEGAGDTENFIAGGAPSQIPGWIANLITQTRCDWSKDLSLQADGGTRFVKNNWELKTGQYIILDASTVFNCWESRDQQGVTFVLTPQPDTAQATVKDIQLSRIRCGRSPRFLVLYGRRLGDWGETAWSQHPRSERIYLDNILATEYDKITYQGLVDYCNYIGDDPKDLFINHVTISRTDQTTAPNIYSFIHSRNDDSLLGENLKITNSIIPDHEGSGYKEGGGATVASQKLDKFWSSWSVKNNALPHWNDHSGLPGNFFPSNDDAPFIDRAGGNYHVVSGLQNQGTDGKDIGADVDLLGRVTLNVEQGNGQLAPSGPPDTTPPTLTLAASSTNVTAAGNVVLTATASDNVGVNRVEFYEGGTLLLTDYATPYQHTLSFTAAQNGSHTYRAKAFDGAGNFSAFDTVTIVVNISDTVPPTATSKVIPSLGTTIVLTLSEAVTSAGVVGNYTVSDNSVTSAVLTDSTHITLGLATTVLQSQVVTISYSGTTVVDTSGNQLAAFTNSSVTNNSTQTAPGSQTLTSIVVTPTAASVGVGSTRQLAAVARDQIGSPMVTQPTFTWSSSVPAKATVNSSGLVTSVSVGSTVVTANVGSLASSPSTITVVSGIPYARGSVTAELESYLLLNNWVDSPLLQSKLSGEYVVPHVVNMAIISYIGDTIQIPFKVRETIGGVLAAPTDAVNWEYWFTAKPRASDADNLGIQKKYSRGEIEVVNASDASFVAVIDPADTYGLVKTNINDPAIVWVCGIKCRLPDGQMETIAAGLFVLIDAPTKSIA